MKVGDLVKYMDPHSLKARTGIVLERLEDMDIGLSVYIVLCDDGTTETYTSAVLRDI